MTRPDTAEPSRGTTHLAVRAVNGDPVEFHRRPDRRNEHYLVVGVLERWSEKASWPYLSPMPVSGDRCRCWRVLARRSSEPDSRPGEFVLRMRSGPGVWDLSATGGSA